MFLKKCRLMKLQTYLMRLEDDKAEMLLKEMDSESSQEVRELLEYADDHAGGLMTTDVLSFTFRAYS